MHTAASVHTTLAQHVESNAPDDVLKALQPFDGKKITTRLLDALPGGKDQWRLVRQYGWTELQTQSYTQSGGVTGMRLVLARSEASVPLSVAFVEAENPAYFVGRRERNAARFVAVSEEETLQTIATAMNQLEAARTALAVAEQQFADVTHSAYRRDLAATLAGEPK